MATCIRLTPMGQDRPSFFSLRTTPEDKSISYGALGMWNYLMSLPDTWKIRLQPKDLERKDCGIDKVYKLLEELQEAGYIFIAEQE